MTAPTHIAFAASLGLLCGVDGMNLKLLAGGALLPDLDHPQSALGRVCFFLSIPLNKWLGHRRTWHGLALWSAIALGGWLWAPACWLGLGAITHIVLDALNTSGVQLFMPFSERVCVLFSRRYRFPSGSKQELVLLVVLGSLGFAGGYIGSRGGMQAVLGAITGSYQVAYQQYVTKGLQRCALVGRLRWVTGAVEEGRWEIVGMEGNGLALWDGTRLIHVPEQGQFLRCRLVCQEASWQASRLSGVVTTLTEIFFFDGQRWIHAAPGGRVFGQVIGRELRFAVVERE
jgi:inner membrane protein